MKSLVDFGADICYVAALYAFNSNNNNNKSHIGNAAIKPGSAAQKTVQNKIDKYSKLASTHLLPVCHRNSWYMA